MCRKRSGIYIHIYIIKYKVTVMTQETKETNVTLDSKFKNGTALEKKCSTKIHQDVPKEQSYTLYYMVILDHEKVRNVLSCNFSVTIQNSIRKSFNTQEDYIAFCKKYGTQDNPFRITFANLGRKIITPEQKVSDMKRDIAGMSSEEKKALQEIVNNM